MSVPFCQDICCILITIQTVESLEAPESKDSNDSMIYIIGKNFNLKLKKNQGFCIFEI